MPTNHAILSASSSHRWLECPPSAKLCAELPDTSSEYAQEGTDAHALCEHRLKALLGRETTDPTENLTYYNEEMCLYFDWFGGCIQAFIFCTLTAIFIKRAAGED